MRRTQILVVGLAIVVGYILASVLNQPTAGQPSMPRPAPQEPAEGRYRVAVTGDNANASNVVVTDTVTGRCWLAHYVLGGQFSWLDLGSPVPAKK